MRLIADLWTSSELLHIRKDPSGLSFSSFESPSFPSVFGFFPIRNRISACSAPFDQSDVGTKYVLLSPACLTSPPLLLPLCMCFTFRRPGSAFQLQCMHWASLSSILCMHFRIYFDSALRYSLAPFWDILGRHFQIFLGYAVRYAVLRDHHVVVMTFLAWSAYDNKIFSLCRVAWCRSFPSMYQFRDSASLAWKVVCVNSLCCLCSDADCSWHDSGDGMIVKWWTESYLSADGRFIEVLFPYVRQGNEEITMNLKISCIHA
jgi:hypothetical protein